MSLQDPISDMLTRIRNAQAVGKSQVSFSASKLKKAICQVLKAEGYINDFAVHAEQAASEQITVDLKYFEGRPVIAMLKRVSRPGLRRYTGKDKLPQVQSGLGVAIMSTSHGVMTDRAARKLGQGGEIICYIS